MTKLKPLDSKQLYATCDVKEFNFQSTADLEPGIQSIGQDRALEAINFSIDIQKPGYNLYVLGPTGAGKHTLVRDVITRRKGNDYDVFDWCYVNNFENSNRCIAICLPAGSGQKLQKDLHNLTETLSHVIPKAFEAESYDKQLLIITGQYRSLEEQAFNDLEKRANTLNIAFVQSDAEFSFAPISNDEVMKPAEYNSLSKEDQEKIQDNVSLLQNELQVILQKIPRWQQESQEKVKKLNEEIAKNSSSFWINELVKKYHDYLSIGAHLKAIQQDVIDNVEQFLSQNNNQHDGQDRPVELKHFLKRYHINLIVENHPAAGPPIVYETNPTLDNLIGKIDSVSQYGTLISDFSLIKAGALHKANGGFLIIDAYKIIGHHHSWDALKRALSTREIIIDPSTQGNASTITLSPTPIPLEVKVILLGDHSLYFSLMEHDPEFGALFKVVADFEDSVVLNEENKLEYAKLITTLSNAHELRAFDRSAVARVIEQSSRWQENQNKLTTHIGKLKDLLTEADYWAAKNNHLHVNAADIEQAIKQQQYRVSRLKTEVHDSILRNTTIIATDGEVVGQVNGLTIASLGHFTFGQPSRITATARLGDGKVIDIEHESNLGGDIHTKGVLILSHFFTSNFAKDKSLSFNASLVFEQSYGEIDGDSASAAELIALMSALTGIPIKQSIALTGSVNQHGHIQAVGGINDKIEGYFDICAKRGLTNEHGVIIPEANQYQLMLRKEVRDAANNNLFKIYAVKHINEIIEILTGLEAGIKKADGTYPDKSFNAKVEARLAELALLADESDDNESGHDH